MLVWVRQLIQVSRPGATCVGLKLCDQWQRRRRDVLQETAHALALRVLTCDARNEARARSLHRELCPRYVFPRLHAGKVVDDVVERRAKVVDRLSDGDAHTPHPAGVPFRDVKDDGSSLVHSSGDEMFVRVRPRLLLALEGPDQLPCTPDTKFCAEQGRCAGALHALTLTHG